MNAQNNEMNAVFLRQQELLGRTLLNNGNSLNTGTTVAHTSEDLPTTPLLAALMSNSEKCAEYLLTNASEATGRELNVPLCSGKTAFYICCERGNVKIASIMLEIASRYLTLLHLPGAKTESLTRNCLLSLLDLKTCSGKTPLHTVIDHSHEKLLDFLCDHGFVEVRHIICRTKGSDHGVSPFMLAEKRGKMSLILPLLRAYHKQVRKRFILRQIGDKVEDCTHSYLTLKLVQYKDVLFANEEEEPIYPGRVNSGPGSSSSSSSSSSESKVPSVFIHPGEMDFGRSKFRNFTSSNSSDPLMMVTQQILDDTGFRRNSGNKDYINNCTLLTRGKNSSEDLDGIDLSEEEISLEKRLSLNPRLNNKESSDNHNIKGLKSQNPHKNRMEQRQKLQKTVANMQDQLKKEKEERHSTIRAKAKSYSNKLSNLNFRGEIRGPVTNKKNIKLGKFSQQGVSVNNIPNCNNLGGLRRGYGVAKENAITPTRKIMIQDRNSAQASTDYESFYNGEPTVTKSTAADYHSLNLLPPSEHNQSESDKPIHLKLPEESMMKASAILRARRKVTEVHSKSDSLYDEADSSDESQT